MTFVLARHGESEYSARSLLNGDEAVACGLTLPGVEQARALGAALAAEPLELCVTSALQRARETADEALRGREVPRLVLPELNDPRYGRFEGATLAEYRAWAADAPSSALPPGGGESRHAIVERYALALRLLLARPEQAVLVVAHSLPIAYVLAAREHVPPSARVALAEYATPYRFTRRELADATAFLEAWVAAPTW